MSAGIKGIFGAGEDVERSEPSLRDFPTAEEDEKSTVLNFESRPDDEEDVLEQAEDVADEDEADDQLTIPSFLRKQA